MFLAFDWQNAQFHQFAFNKTNHHNLNKCFGEGVINKTQQC
jgi:hypothetical protein